MTSVTREEVWKMSEGGYVRPGLTQSALFTIVFVHERPPVDPKVLVAGLGQYTWDKDVLTSPVLRNGQGQPCVSTPDTVSTVWCSCD